MIALEPATILSAFAIFCRIGGCLLIAPGFSSSQIPPVIRLYVALAVSLAVTPILLDTVKPVVGNGAPGVLLPLIFSELAAGLLIGFLARLFFLALDTITAAITNAIGLSAIPGTMIEDNEQVPALTALFSLTATTVMFITGLHVVLLRGLIDSYSAMPPGEGFAARLAVVGVADQLNDTFLLALRIGSPFIVYSIVVNFATGVANKLTPQIPVFFIAVPFVMAGGLILLLLTVGEFIEQFEAAFSAWLVRG